LLHSEGPSHFYDILTLLISTSCSVICSFPYTLVLTSCSGIFVLFLMLWFQLHAPEICSIPYALISTSCSGINYMLWNLYSNPYTLVFLSDLHYINHNLVFILQPSKPKSQSIHRQSAQSRKNECALEPAHESFCFVPIAVPFRYPSLLLRYMLDYSPASLPISSPVNR